MNHRKASKESWLTIIGGRPTLEEIKVGSLQRIADAAELMAQNHAQLIRERDNYKRWYEAALDRRHSLERRVAALRGVITKMKRRSE